MKITSQIKIEKKKVKEINASIKHIKKLGEELGKSLKKDVSDILSVILGGAINLGASDIHFEPEEEEVKLRLRIDGILHDVLLLKKEIYFPLLSRIKLLSGIKLNITLKAQDGRFTILLEKETGEEKIETRVSTLPSEYGEATVLRLLDPKSLIEIEQLGIRKDILETFKREIRQPNGMIITTGPTGSGKTTTLYAILKKVRDPKIKIITIEDPIEYHLEGISQSQVNPKKNYNFANGLKAIVRQDPDVILVGEIRDFETAKIALQSSLTGHLVLTTLHTNDATGTISRLQALGEKLVNIAPAINLAIGQRLVRKVCPNCASFEKPNSKELEKIKRGLKNLPKKIKESINIPVLNKNLKIPKAKGCASCNFTGYKKRIGIYEFFIIDEEMENFILKAPSMPEIRKKARQKGMATMREDGLIKVIQGITTLDEIERIMGE